MISEPLAAIAAWAMKLFPGIQEARGPEFHKKPMENWQFEMHTQMLNEAKVFSYLQRRPLFFFGGGEGDVPAKYLGIYRIHATGRFTYVGLTFAGKRRQIYHEAAPSHEEVLHVESISNIIFCWADLGRFLFQDIPNSLDRVELRGKRTTLFRF